MKEFPILGSNIKSVPYGLVEKHNCQAFANHMQNVDRLAERGGLAWDELYYVLSDKPFDKRKLLIESTVEEWIQGEVNKYNKSIMSTSIKADRLGLRPCVVINGRKLMKEDIKKRGVLINAYFHTWTEVIDTDKNKIFKSTLALVEYEDGSIDKIYPENLRFIV
jgi:hypothetical protein